MYRSDKKKNMEYWDEIDNLVIELVRNLAGMSDVPVKLNEQEELDLSKYIEEYAIQTMESWGFSFPYVDSNY